MARNKPFPLKLRLAYEKVKNRLPPHWAILRKFGIGRGKYYFNMALRMKRKRNWRRNKLKV